MTWTWGQAMPTNDEKAGAPRSGDGTVTRQRWRQDPDAVRLDILRVATEAFAANGLSGGRIDDIAQKTRTSKRMIYYYYGDKLSLYRAVLEQAYRSMRESEQALDLEALDPVQALRQLVEFTFEHHMAHPGFIRLVMIENVHEGRHLAESTIIRELNETAIDELKRILQRGRAAGLFREGITPLQLHWQISALSFFNVSNRATFSSIFGDSLQRPRGRNALRRQVAEMVLRFVLRPELIEAQLSDASP